MNDITLSTTVRTKLLKDPKNKIVERALNRLKENKINETHVGHHTKHSSHATHSKGLW